MAQKDNPKSRKAQFVGYVPYNVDTQIKDAVKKHPLKLDKLLDEIVSLAEDGCKVSFAWEDDRGCWFIQAFQQTPKHVNAGLILSARHADLLTACRLFSVVHYEVFNEVWVAPQNGANQYDW